MDESANYRNVRDRKTAPKFWENQKTAQKTPRTAKPQTPYDNETERCNLAIAFNTSDTMVNIAAFIHYTTHTL